MERFGAFLSPPLFSLAISQRSEFHDCPNKARGESRVLYLHVHLHVSAESRRGLLVVEAPPAITFSRVTYVE